VRRRGKAGSPARLLGALALAALACGGDGAEDLTFRTALDAKQTLARLTASEATRLCDETREWAQRAYGFAQLHEPLCRRRAVTGAVLMPTTTDTALEASCQRAYGQCLQQQDSAPEPLGDAPCVPSGTPCVATIGQLVECMNDLDRVFMAALAVVNHCGDLTAREAASVPFRTLTIPASCRELTRSCPQLVLPWPPEVSWVSPP
jgi:hypothetical protein